MSWLEAWNLQEFRLSIFGQSRTHLYLHVLKTKPPSTLVILEHFHRSQDLPSCVSWFCMFVLFRNGPCHHSVLRSADRIHLTIHKSMNVIFDQALVNHGNVWVASVSHQCPNHRCPVGSLFIFSPTTFIFLHGQAGRAADLESPCHCHCHWQSMSLLTLLSWAADSPLPWQFCAMAHWMLQMGAAFDADKCPYWWVFPKNKSHPDHQWKCKSVD